MKWLITGGCGFIGRSLIARLVDEGRHEIIVFDNLSVGTRQDLASVCTFKEGLDYSGCADTVRLIVGDITDINAVKMAVTGVDCVVHLAANTGVAPSVESPLFDCTSNVIGTVNTLEAVRHSKGCRFVFASSGAPLGVQTPPLHEEMSPHPASPYGASKLAGEGYCSAYFHSFGVETIALRFGNVYGPRSARKMSVVAKFIKQALSGEVLEIYGDGAQTRDFIYIDDLVDAIYRAATFPEIGGETFQIATSRETTVYEITEKLLDVMEKLGLERPRVIYGQRRTGDVERNYSDTSKAEKVLSWKAKKSLTDGLSETVKSFL
jgi:UDP-glucose 4-epimerase